MIGDLIYSKYFWFDLLSKGLDKSIDKEVIQNFSTDKYRNDVIEKLLAGSWVITPPTMMIVPKDNNKFRTVYVNTDEDRIVLSAINKLLVETHSCKLSRYCLSYTPEWSTGKLVKQLANRLGTSYEGVKIDLKSYFDSVPVEILNNCLNQLYLSEGIDKVLFKYYNDDRVFDSKGNILKKYKSIGQGCGPSAFISNYVLNEIDKEISSKVDIYYRYADDIIMIGDTWQEALDLIKHRLHEIGLVINENKTVLINNSKEFTFLGYKIKGSVIGISDKTWVSFKALVNKYCRRNRYKTINENSLKYLIKSINKRLYGGKYFWMERLFSTVNNIEDFHRMDCYLKDRLRYYYTGSNNTVSNKNKLSNEKLKELGYTSILCIYNNYKNGKEYFNQYLEVMVL